MSKAIETRRNILRQAFQIIYRQGFQATSIDEIIARTHVTKGAFFYHFKNKDQMGLAIIKEILHPGFVPYMQNVLYQAGDVREKLYKMMEGLLLHDTFFNVQYGCPAVNMIEEMAPLNPAFKKVLMKIVNQWHAAIARSIQDAQEYKQLANSHSPEDIATYMVSGYSGVRIVGKMLGKNAYLSFLRELKKFLNHLC